MNKTKLVIKSSILLVGISIILYYLQPIMEFLRIIADQEAVSAYLQKFGSLGPIILFVLLVSQVFVAVIPGHALMVTAGYAYGMLGFFVVIISTILGSQCAFVIARKFGRVLINKIAPPEIIEKWDKVAHHQGFLFFFFSFVLPIFPSDLMCYVAGLSTIPPRRFLVANILGRTCCAVFITCLGFYSMNPPVWFWLIAILGISSVFLGWNIYKRQNSLQVL